jgi:hypothetical protein
MGASLPAVVGWIFVAIFVFVAIIVLLDLAGIRRIADEEQRKWLFRSLIAAVVVAVTGLGTAHLKRLEPGPALAQTGASSTPQASASPIPPPAATPSPSPRPTASTAPQDGAIAQGQCAADPTVAAWASVNLGERPRLPAEFDREYPACVAKLRAAETPASDEEVSTCVNALDQHHQRFILGFYRTKEAYDLALKKWERSLRRTGIDEGERALYNHVVCENEDLNDPGGPTLESRDIAEQRIAEDRKACRRNRCRAPVVLAIIGREP